MISYLEFEKPIAALEARIAELRETAQSGALDITAEIRRLEGKSAELLASTYRSLTPWQKTLVARHPSRPHFRDYVSKAFTDFMPLGGDRKFGEDHAIVGGFATLEGRAVMLIGHEKGHDTQSRIRHNFGMGKPEGYRKAVRLMEMASRYGLPVVTLVDTSGAFPGVEAEERGQAEAIARSTEACLALGVPMVAAIVGEGGSGGAVALASAERVLMFEHAVYSVISPEGCASILWRTAEKAPEAAEAMRMTARGDRPDCARACRRRTPRQRGRSGRARQGDCRGTHRARRKTRRYAACAARRTVPAHRRLRNDVSTRTK
jgi:acetyl-CoA carboxylase carboxyl transferase subunit alpha